MDKITHSEKYTYTFKDLCNKSVNHPTPLIEFIDTKTIDCMGKKIAVMDFCDQMRAADPYYLRGIADEATKTVICQSGRTLDFKYLCSKRSDDVFCRLASTGCLEIKNQLAKRLNIVRGAITVNDKNQKELNCYFDAKDP